VWFLIIFSIFSRIIFVLIFVKIFKFLTFKNFYISTFKFLTFNLIFLYFCLVRLLKIPIFRFHIWLPKVHVEANILTSIILARLLLKSRIFLILYIFNFIFDINFYVFLCWFLIGSFWSTLVIFKQVDLKVFIAYSSVLHISFCCFCIFLSNFYGIFSRIFMRLIHRILSPLIFYWSYDLYYIFNSRINFSNLRFLNFSNKFLIIFILIFNLRFPIFRCFFAEIFRFLSLIFNFNFYISIFRFFVFIRISNLRYFVIG